MATETMRARLQAIISDLVEEIRRYAERKHDPGRLPVANPPATAEEIDRLERYIGQRLPASYRTFLQMHNGFRRLAYPGHMLKVQDMMPPSPVHARILEWKRMTAQYGGGEVLDSVVIASGNEPNHWVYLDPNQVTGENEWCVVAHTPMDDSTFPDLVAYLEGRLREMRGIHENLDRGKLRG